MKGLLKLKLQARTKLKNHKLVIAGILLIGIGIGLIGGYFIWHGDTAADIEQAIVNRVIDGDTIELANGRRVRYLGIDTPESGEFYALEATARNVELVEGKVVELQQGKRDCDDYGRLLRYVYVDGVFVNAQLIVEGYAVAYIFDPDERYSQVLVQLEQYAKMKERGIWGNKE